MHLLGSMGVNSDNYCKPALFLPLTLKTEKIYYNDALGERQQFLAERKKLIKQ